jgi:hypothetical protein
MGRRRKNQEKQASPGTPPGAARWPYLQYLVAAIVVLVVAGSALAIVLGANSGGSDSNDEATKKAVIVDQLSLTNPHPEFISEARETLAEAGYSVDYIAGEDVTVDIYRALPDRGYDLVLLRVHAGITTETDQVTGEQTGTEYVSLFTGEPYDEGKYSEEQLNRLGKARYDENSDPLFGIGPEFIEKSMRGDFNGAVVVMMGCDGLRSQRTAEAFLDRGASAFVSWSKPISAGHTDTATEALLQRLLIEGLPVEEAVSQTAAEVGPDPVYEGELRVLTAGA